MSKQLKLFKEEELPVWVNEVPFVSEVETFNATFGKPNNYEPTIPEEKEWKFVYDFILEELEEYREACERGDIVEVLDALCDIAYVSIGNGTMLHALKIRYGQRIKKYKQVICRKLVKLKKRPYSPSANEVRNKVRPAILKNLRKDGILYIERETEK